MYKNNNGYKGVSSAKKLLELKNKTQIDSYRIKIVVSAFIVIFLLLTIRLFDVSLLQNNNKKTSYVSHALTSRPQILDRNGVILAVDLDTASLYANPKIILDKKEVAEKLMELFPELSKKQLLEDFNSNKTFVWIKRNLTPKQQHDVNVLGVPGLLFENTTKRIYTHGPLLSHVVGFVGVDGKGLAGIEKYYDDKLAYKQSSEKAITLSIDVRVQNIVSEELAKVIQEHNAIAATGILIDANNGEVIAAVSLPSFDPHNPGSANQEQRFNRFSLGVYEPGSTAKSFTMAMALDNNITLDDVYNVNEPIKAGKFKIHDFHGKGGFLSATEIFMYSSNIGTAKIALDLGKKKQQEYLKRFGLFEMLDIELPEKGKPLYPSDSRWSNISTMTIAFGHGIATTPLHIIRTLNGLVNGGIMHDLTFLKKSDDNKKNEAIRIVKSSTSLQMQKLFRLVVDCCSGRKANAQGYLVGGKTGTAEKLAKGGGYNKNSRLSSFIASFPINKPKYSLLVMIDDPKGNQSTGGLATAGLTAAPACGNIIARIGPILNVETIDESNEEILKQLDIEFNGVSDDEL